MALLSWRLFLVCIFLNFFVMVEPAPADLVFFAAAFCLALTPMAEERVLSGVAILGVCLYLVSSVTALFFVEHNFAFAVRAVLIEGYMIGLFVLTAHFCATRGDDAFFWILMALLLGALVSAAIGFLALGNLIPRSDLFFRGEGVRNRLMSTFKDPNVFGPYLVPSILFSAWLMVSSKKFFWLGTAGFAALLIVLVATLSRGAMIHAAISLFLMMIALLVHHRSAAPTFLALLGVSALGCVVVLTMLDAILLALEGSLLGDRMSLQSYDDNRFSHVADAITHVLEHPLGIGQGQSRYLYGYLPHNTFVAFALQNGLGASVGLLLIYLAAMGRCLMKVLDQRPGWTKYAMILAVLCGLLVLMQVVGASHWRHLYIVCGLAFGVYRTDAPTAVGRQWPAAGLRDPGRRPGLLHRALSPEGDRHV